MIMYKEENKQYTEKMSCQALESNGTREVKPWIGMLLCLNMSTVEFLDVHNNYEKADGFQFPSNPFECFIEYNMLLLNLSS